MEAVIDSSITANGKEIDITFVRVITWVVHCVEVYSESVATGKGSSKFAIFWEAVPKFLQAATAAQLCSEQHAATVLAQFENGRELVGDIVSALIAVAHNPQFVQMEEALKKCCASAKKK